VRRVREAVGANFIIIFRLSMLDLVEGGSSSWEEVVQPGQASSRPASRISTPASAGTRRAFPPSPPRCRAGAFAWVTKQLKGKVGIPLVTTNRINTPGGGRAVLAEGNADMVSMARPFLADPDFVNKAAAGRADEINTCIGCNQACLDHTFGGKITSCLVNPRACHETW
jgi:2,4-dienoyl-CoA reductase (NADPH2)